MKKLLIALTACATALFASAVTTFEDFEGTLGSFSGNGGSVVSYEGTAPSLTNYPFPDAGSKYCAIDADETDKLERTITSDESFLDMYVQFPENASEPTPEIANDTKLVVYLNSDTNVVVISGDGNGGVVTNTFANKVAAGQWVRLTIQQQNRNTSGSISYGYRVFINGVALNGGDNDFFTSLQTNAIATKIAFDGVGKLDNFAARDWYSPFAFSTDAEMVAAGFPVRVGGIDGNYYGSINAYAIAESEAVGLPITVLSVNNVNFEAQLSNVASGKTFNIYNPNGLNLNSIGNANRYRIVDNGNGNYTCTRILVWDDYLNKDMQGTAYAINNANDLDKLREGVAAGLSTVGVTFKQTADIDMASAGAFVGIGTYNADPTAGKPFAGTYDGGNFKICNVDFTQRNYGGVFNQVNGGTIKNLTVSNITCSAFSASANSGEWGGAIVGNAGNGATLQNLVAEGTFAADHPATHNVAGIVIRACGGGENGTLIKDCTNNATLYGAYTKIGGICAITQYKIAGGAVTFDGCVNNGDIISSRTTATGVTGYAGILGYNDDNTVIVNCSNTGSIVNESGANTDKDGAIVGWAYTKDANSVRSLTDQGGNSAAKTDKMLAFISGLADVTGFKYATVANDVATTVTSLSAGNTYLLEGSVAASETPVFTFAEAGTIAFDAALGYTFDGIVAADTSTLVLSDETVDNVTTYTAVAGVASVGGQMYATMQDAFDAVTAQNNTVTLLSDLTETVTLNPNETVTITLVPNNHNITTATPFAAANGIALGVMSDNGDGTWSMNVINNKASTWTGTAGDELWATASNWSTGVVPGEYTTVTFGDDADVGLGTSDDIRSVAGLVVNGNVNLRHDTRNYAYYPSVRICGGNVTGTGTLTLERCGLSGNSSQVEVGCDLVFKGDSATSHDSFLQQGPFVINGDVSSTLGRLHLLTQVTFNGAVNLANATITSAITGGSAPTFNGAVTLGTGATISTYAVTYNNALTIGEGAVVSVGSSTQTYGENFTMTGSGRFIGDTQLPSGKAKTALTQSTWTGTCELKGMTIKSVWWITDYGNENSKVCFNNVTTYLYNSASSGSHMVAGIEIGQGGFKINGIYSSGNWRLPKLSGTGTFTVGTAGDNNKNVYLPADCSEFSGSIAFASDTANTRVVFGTTDREFKEKTICVGSDAVVGAGATWTASDEIYLDGIVKASANTSLSTVVGSGKIVYGAVPTGTHTFGEGWTGIGALDYKGADRIDLANYVNTIAERCSCDTVEIVEGSTIPGRSYFNVDVVPTLKVSGFVSIGDGSSTAGNKRTIPTLTGDGVVDFQNYAQVNYAVNSVVDWNGVITNSSTVAFVTNIVSGTGKVVYSVFPENAGAPVVGSGFSGEVVLGFNANQKAISDYGGANSTIVLTDISGDNTYLPNGDIDSKVRIDGTVAIKNGNPLTANDSFNDWTNDRVITTPYLKVDGALSFAKTTGAGKSWSNLRCYYYAKVLDASGAGTIEVGNQFGLRIDAVDFAAAPSGTNRLVPLTLTEVPYVSGETQYVDVGRLYGPNGVDGEPIPVTVNGVATEQTLVYDAVKGGLVLYVASSEIDPDQGATVDVDTTKSEEDQRTEAQTKANTMDVVKTAAASNVDQATWNGYFTKSVEKVGDDWVATATLNPAVVLPVDGVEETPLTDMLESVTEAALDTDTTAASVPTKAGLYYWIAGATEVGATTYTPGTAKLGDGTTQELAMPVLSGENGKAFYKVCVDLEAPVTAP